MWESLRAAAILVHVGAAAASRANFTLNVGDGNNLCALFAAVSAEVRPEQRRVHAVPQSPPDASAHPGHFCRQ